MQCNLIHPTSMNHSFLCRATFLLILIHSHLLHQVIRRLPAHRRRLFIIQWVRWRSRRRRQHRRCPNATHLLVVVRVGQWRLWWQWRGLHPDRGRWGSDVSIAETGPLVCRDNSDLVCTCSGAVLGRRQGMYHQAILVVVRGLWQGRGRRPSSPAGWRLLAACGEWPDGRLLVVWERRERRLFMLRDGWQHTLVRAPRRSLIVSW